MIKYIFKRILHFFPTLFIISLLAFAISVNSPGDPVERMLTVSSDEGEQNNSNSSLAHQKEIWHKKLGLNLPLFYFELADFASPDTFYKISNKSERETLKRLLFSSGDWTSVSKYSCALHKFNASLNTICTDSAALQEFSQEEIKSSISELKAAGAALISTAQKSSIDFQFQVIENNLSFLKLSQQISINFNSLKHDLYSIEKNSTRWKNFIPVIHFHVHNQYHQWLFGDGNSLTGEGSNYSKGILRGDFGSSYASKETVSKRIGSRIAISLFFSLVSILLAYLISIPIAVKAAAKPHSNFDKYSSLLLFALYSLPSFFVATLLLMTFANPDVWAIFPTSGLAPVTGIPENASILFRLKLQIPYLILPLFCYTYSSLAFLSRSMRSSLLENLDQDYIRTARAKGLSESKILYKHAVKNSLLPMISLFSSIFPYAIGGAVVLETIFTLPGMGLETYAAIQNQDYPVLVAVFTIAGFLTLISSLLADILYAFVDPRITFSKTP